MRDVGIRDAEDVVPYNEKPPGLLHPGGFSA